MKVLFAVNNDNISEAIVKKYQKDYKEIISYKNVYYFNAILKELQNDKSYDRVVISEDLEPFANNNYDTIDKFLFEKLDKISDEATKANGEDIQIVLICTDRRSKSDEMMTKIFGIGIYNALIGEERNVDNLCKLLNQPRTKKEAKIAYRIEGNNVSYQIEDENSVSESEVQNILAHYKRLGRNEDKYVDSFNNIVSQYTDAQLKIIIRYLPLHVKAVLEEKSPKYQQLSTFATNNTKTQEPYRPRNLKSIKQEEKIKVKMLNEEKGKITKPIVIPSTLNNNKVLRLEKKKTLKQEQPVNDKPEINELEQEKSNVETAQKRGRGRPKKVELQNDVEEMKPKKGRGRPKKEPVELQDDELFDDIDLFNIENKETPARAENNFNQEPQTEDDMDFDLFNMDMEGNTLQDNEEDSENENQETEQEDMDLTQNFEEDEESNEDIDLFNINTENEENQSTQENSDNNLNDFSDDLFDTNNNSNNELENTTRTEAKLSNFYTQEKKIVSFVGTTKNGTSFIVNNLALMLSSMNISTAILDMTQSKNAYYIFTKNEEKLRGIAENSIVNLENGIARGIDVNRNLTVYTEIPGEHKNHENIENILVTLMQNHDIVLIDADFNTPDEYFDKSQEIYLVQSMDILTIQPLTAFLRNLKTKNILRQEKLKIIINKAQRVRNLSDKILIGGISSYNDPGMAFMTELFNKENIMYCKVPFEVQNYVKYLDSLVNCEITLRGYTKSFMIALNELAEMVYPLVNKSKYNTENNKKRRMQFSNETTSTLNKMRNNY